MTTLSENIFNSYLTTPEKPAITLIHNQNLEQTITYRDLFQGASAFMKALEEAGILPGEVVILILNHGENLIYSFFGAILHGAIPSIMPFLTEKLEPDHYRQSLTSLFEITKPAAIITYPEFIDEVHITAQNTPSIRAIISTSQIHPCDNFSMDQIQGLKRCSEDTVLLQHSSGTTGLQKGVALSHQAIFNQIDSYSKSLQLNRSKYGQDTIVSWLPLYHDMGLIAGFIMPILTQTHLVLMSPFDWVRAPYKLMQYISKFRGSLCWMPNFAYNFCAQKIRPRDLENVDLSSCRAVINCSEPMSWQSHQMFLERFEPYGFRDDALATSYAMAENVFAVTQGGIDTPLTIDFIERQSLLSGKTALVAKCEASSVKMVSVGKPIENTQVKIVDNHGNTLPERHIGEIALLSNCMLSGYYRRPDLTEKAFIDGWFLTGDLGYIANQEVYITGRKKDLIIVGGKNVYPQDLERLASEIPSVHPGRVVAFGVFNDEIGTEEVVIIAEVDTDAEEEKIKIGDEIRRHVTRGSDIALRYVHIVGRNWLIKTSSGKIARSANREKYLTEYHLT
ncbi:MAG: AMP-binding protein [Anaerolineaceae bacterium]